MSTLVKQIVDAVILNRYGEEATQVPYPNVMLHLTAQRLYEILDLAIEESKQKKLGTKLQAMIKKSNE